MRRAVAASGAGLVPGPAAASLAAFAGPRDNSFATMHPSRCVNRDLATSWLDT